MPDLLLRGARLVGRDAPVDVAIDGGGITGVSSSIAAGRAEVVDCGGRLLLPGLWDEHVHFTQWALVRRRLDVSAATSAAGVAQLVRDRVDAGPPPGSGPLVGYGFRDAAWPFRRPRRPPSVRMCR